METMSTGKTIGTMALGGALFTIGNNLVKKVRAAKKKAKDREDAKGKEVKKPKVEAEVKAPAPVVESDDMVLDIAAEVAAEEVAEGEE